MPLLTYNDIEKIDPIFRGKMGHLLADILIKIMGIDKVSELYDNNSQYIGVDFAHHILQDIGVNYQVINRERLEQLPDGGFITISNHPYGSIDGIMLIDMIGQIRPDYKVLVNQFLGHIKCLEPNFIKVVPKGDNNEGVKRESLKGILQSLKHLESGAPLGLFPAGAVSNLYPRQRRIEDREWQISAIQLIKRAHLPVVPIRFLDRNSIFFYLLGLIDWRVRVSRLPREVFNKRGKQVRVEIGKTISPEQIDTFDNILQLRDCLRASIYPPQRA